MSLNMVKSIKSKLTGSKSKDERRMKVLFMMIKKLKDEKKSMLDEFAAKGDAVNSLKLEIENLKELDLENCRQMEAVEAMHNNIVENLVETVGRVREKVECPVCLEIPRTGPVFVCHNGHFVCKKCKGREKSCPTCKESMGKGKSLLAVTVIENIDHKCKFVECEELFPLKKVEAHEKVCKHRFVTCPRRSCFEEVALSKVLVHLGKKTCCVETVPLMMNSSFRNGQVFLKVEPREMKEFADRELDWKVSLFSYKKSKFVISSQKSGQYFHFTMVMLESKEVCSKFKIEMEVKERSASCKESELGIRFRGSPCSIDQDKEEVKYLGLTVHYKVMKELILRDQELNFMVSFSFSEKRSRGAE